MEENNFFEDSKEQEVFSKNIDDGKQKEEEYSFLKKGQEYAKTEPEEVYSHLEKRITDLDKDTTLSKLKSGVYDILKKVGVSGYDLEIHKKINTHKKNIQNLESIKDSYSISLNGSDQIQGLIPKNQEDKLKAQKIIEIIYPKIEGQKELLKAQEELEEKIKDVNKLDERIVIQKEINLMKLDYEVLTDGIENFKSEFDVLESVISLDKRIIEDKRHRLKVVNSYLRQYKSKLNFYELYVGKGKELSSFIDTGKILKSDKLKITDLSEKNDLLEEVDYFLTKNVNFEDVIVKTKNSFLQKKKNEEINDSKQMENTSIDNYINRFERLFE